MTKNIKLVQAAASLACTGTGRSSSAVTLLSGFSRRYSFFESGLSSRFGVFVRMVIGSSFERSGPSAGVAAGLGVRTHGWVVLVGPVVRR